MLRTVPHIGSSHGNQHSIVGKWRLDELGLKVAKKFQMTKKQVSIFKKIVELSFIALPI